MQLTVNKYMFCCFLNPLNEWSKMIPLVVFEEDFLSDGLEKIHRLKGGLIYGSQALVLTVLLLVSKEKEYLLVTVSVCSLIYSRIPSYHREPETDPTVLNRDMLREAHMANRTEMDTPRMLLSGLTILIDASRLKNRSVLSISRKYLALPENSPPLRPGAFHGVRSSSQFTPEITTKFALCVSAIESSHGSSCSFSLSGRMM